MKILSSVNFLLLFTAAQLHTCVFGASISQNVVEPTVLKFKSSRTVTPEKVVVDPATSGHLVQQSRRYQRSNATILLQGTDFESSGSDLKNNHFAPSTSFAHSVFHAYKNHHNLVIRPDDIWTAIMVQFSYYVNAHSEELRSHFVAFEGKKELMVNYTGIGGVHNVPFDHYIRQMESLIKDNIKPDVAPWLLPNFTTTTPNDVITSGAVMMATLKNYFDYSLGVIACGIPEITLLGSVEDWKEIRDRVALLPKFQVGGAQAENHMEQWSALLTRILDHFIQVKEGGPVDYSFWENVAKHHADLEGCTDSLYLSGWITAFSVFDQEGQWQVNYNHSHKYSHSVDLCQADAQFETGQDFSSPWPTLEIDNLSVGIVSVPIKIKDDYALDLPNGEYKGVIFAGHVGYGVKEDEVTIQPLSGWAVAVDGKPPAYLKKRMVTGSQ